MSDLYKREDVSDSKIVLTITLPRESFDKAYNELLKEQSKDFNVKGFRKGKVPSDLIEESVKPSLQFECFERLAPMYINTAIQKENLDIIAPPQYSSLPKFEGSDDLEFKIEVTVMPDFKLGNMKKVKVKMEDVTVDEKDVESAIKDLKNNNESDAKKIGDDWAKEIGKKLELEGVDTLEKLKKEVEGLLKKQKEHMLLHQYQEDALKQAISLSDIVVPEPAIQFEADERERAFEQDMQVRGVKVEDFVKNSGLKYEDMKEAWKRDAQDALESDIFLGLYAKENDITVSQEDMDKKIEDIKKSQPNIDQSIFTNENWLEYVKRVEIKQRAFHQFIKSVLGDKFLDEHN